MVKAVFQWNTIAIPSSTMSLCGIAHIEIALPDLLLAK